MIRFKLLFVGLFLLLGFSLITDGSSWASFQTDMVTRRDTGNSTHADSPERIRASIIDQGEGGPGLRNNDHIRLLLKGRGESVDLALGALLLLTMVPPPALLSLNGEPPRGAKHRSAVLAIRDDAAAKISTSTHGGLPSENAVGPRSN
jgi:hypothetical protein